MYDIISESPELKAGFSSPEEIWLHLNQVSPSLIRVEADEVSYSLHIVIRMLLEEQLINENLPVADLPAAWNDLYQEYLGLRPENDRLGVLQDIHWYSGDFGYFPSYALGNLYGGMIYEKMTAEMPEFAKDIKTGDFTKILSWFSKNIFLKGKSFMPAELLSQICGQSLSAQPFLNYLTAKFK